ncbi:ORF6N domain-containing protein [Melioribacter roseus]
MLDSDLAEFYGVETRILNEQVKRNIERFPLQFMFRLTNKEYKNLMSQIAISSTKHGGRRKLPYVFTEQGVAMLSAVLKSETATVSEVLEETVTPNFASSASANSKVKNIKKVVNNE